CQPIVLQAAPLPTVEHGEKSDRRQAGHSRLSVFADDHPIGPRHIIDDRVRGLANLDVLDYGAIDSDAGTAHVLECFGFMPYVDDLARLDPAAGGAFDLFAAEPAVDDRAIVIDRALQIRCHLQNGPDLPDREHILSEIRSREIAILDEDPAFENRGLEPVGDASGVTFAVGSDRSPAGLPPAVAPSYPGGGPGISRNPEPTNLGVIIPPAVMIDRPGERLRGFPVPAVIVRPDPAAFLIWPPAAPLSCRQPNKGKIWMAHPGTIALELIVENIHMRPDSRTNASVRSGRFGREA